MKYQSSCNKLSITSLHARRLLGYILAIAALFTKENWMIHVPNIIISSQTESSPSETRCSQLRRTCRHDTGSILAIERFNDHKVKAFIKKKLS